MPRSYLSGQVETRDGAAVKSAAVYVYTDDAGTTLATLYAAKTGGSALSQPLTSDANGQYAAFVSEPGTYYVKSTDNSGAAVYANNVNRHLPAFTSALKRVNVQLDPSDEATLEGFAAHRDATAAVGNPHSIQEYVATRVTKTVIDALGINAAEVEGMTAAELQSAITAAIVDAAPATLDTLNELAAALGDDPNFATTLTNLIATKASQADLDAEETARANADTAHNAATAVHEITDTLEVEHGNLTQDLIGRRHVPYEHTFDRPLIVICDDDNDRSAVDYVKVELEERFMVGNFACAWEFFSDNGGGAGKISLAEAKTLQDYGHAIEAHSRGHEAITDYAHFVAEAVEIQALLEAQNIRADSHKDPGPWSGDQEFDSHAKTLTRYGRLMRRYFVVHSGYDQTTVYNYTRPLPLLDPYGPGAALTVDSSNLTTLTAAVDNLLAYTDGIGYYAMHSRNLDAVGSLSKADFETWLDYIKTQVDAGKCYVVTMAQAFRARLGPRENLFRDEFFEESATGAYVNWSVASPGGGAPPIGDASAWALGDAATVDSTNNLWQQRRAENLRTVEFACKARRDDTGIAATLRINFRHIDSTGTAVVNSNRDVAIGASADGEEIRGIYTRVDPRAVRLLVRIATTSAAKVRVAEPALMPA